MPFNCDCTCGCVHGCVGYAGYSNVVFPLKSPILNAKWAHNYNPAVEHDLDGASVRDSSPQATRERGCG